MSFNPSYPHSLELLPPPQKISNSDFGDLLIKARVALAELKGACGQLPNPLLLTAPSVLRESVASSNIENINTTLAEVLQWQLFPESEQRQVDKEVLHYREALLWGYEQLDEFPLCSRIINGIQGRLIPEGGGVYRREQNRIVNATTRESLYTPPPAQDIPPLIANWEHFVNEGDEKVDPLIRTIIAHYQFEAIHPFRDGNGRTGRILMVLQLVQEKLLSLPVLYISGYINDHRSDYYKYLLAVTTNENWNDFINFMLGGFISQAQASYKTLNEILKLHHEVKEKVRKENSKIYSAELVDALFTFPVLSPTRLAAALNMHYTTTSRYLAQLAETGILTDAVVGKYHLFANHRLMEILQRG
jgi:Fic family protein